MFLLQVDTEVGKDHLFKRSIILIKAWCYNEARIQGSDQWLLSTYALEILILYIFNMFHKSLHGPFEVIPWKTFCGQLYKIHLLKCMHVSSVFNRPCICFWNTIASLIGANIA